jgi:hypothetical protein
MTRPAAFLPILAVVLALAGCGLVQIAVTDTVRLGAYATTETAKGLMSAGDAVGRGASKLAEHHPSSKATPTPKPAEPGPLLPPANASPPEEPLFGPPLPDPR